MKTVIIEDEKPAARNLNRILNNINIDVIATLHSVEEAIDWIKTNEKPDLGFFDIKLGDGISFEIFENVEVKFPVIFTTAYDEFAIKAFKVNSIDYLLKPIDEEELKSAIDKYHKLFTNENKIDYSIKLNRITELLNPKTFKKRFSIKIGRKYKLINTEDIACFYSKDKATYIKTNENRSHLIDIPLSELESVILDPDLFFRISRQYFINSKYIEEIYAYSNSRLGIKLKKISLDDIIVSREKVKLFKNWIDR
jgi:DNA-binding LytR/AlgR family response regulator